MNYNDTSDYESVIDSKNDNIDCDKKSDYDTNTNKLFSHNITDFYKDETVFNSTQIQKSSLMHVNDSHNLSDATIYPISVSSNLSSDNININFHDRVPWEKHSTGFATKMLKKMGFNGKGLGKKENGISEPITISRSNEMDIKYSEKRKLIYIASSSMLNQMDGQRLSNDKYDVKVRSHGGCKIRCMYSHLPEMFREKPDYLLLHIGSNDCTDKTSDEVLRELQNLVGYIKKVLPAVVVILSLPTVRTDCSRSNAIQQNLGKKIKRLYIPFLDNSLITTSDLGKKGLHFNKDGNRKMAGNIISLIKRL